MFMKNIVLCRLLKESGTFYLPKVKMLTAFIKMCFRETNIVCIGIIQYIVMGNWFQIVLVIYCYIIVPLVLVMSK